MLDRRNASLMDRITSLYEHLKWADERMLSAYEASPAPTQAISLLAHLIAAEAVWLSRLVDRAPSMTVWPDWSISDCRAQLEWNRTEFQTYLKDLKSKDLLRPVSYTNSAGEQFETPVADILLHVAMHGSYHRGQLAAQLRAQGVTPPSTDFIEYVRGAPAARS